MPTRRESVDPVQLGAYFALIEVTSLLRHAIEQQLREAGDLSFVQFQILCPARPALADGQPPHDRPGRRHRLQPQRPDLPGRPAREGGPGHAHSLRGRRARHHRHHHRCRTRAAREGHARPHRGRQQTCSSSRSPGTTLRRSPACWRRCATTCARRHPAQPRLAAAEARSRAARRRRDQRPGRGRVTRTLLARACLTTFVNASATTPVRLETDHRRGDDLREEGQPVFDDDRQRTGWRAHAQRAPEAFVHDHRHGDGRAVIDALGPTRPPHARQEAVTGDGEPRTDGDVAAGFGDDDGFGARLLEGRHRDGRPAPAAEGWAPSSWRATCTPTSSARVGCRRGKRSSPTPARSSRWPCCCPSWAG